MRFIVIFLGVLIIVGVFALVIAIVYRIGGSDEKGEAPTSVIAQSVENIAVSLPEGFELVSVSAAAPNLALHIRDADGKNIIQIIDPATGVLIRTIEVRAP